MYKFITIISGILLLVSCSTSSPIFSEPVVSPKIVKQKTSIDLPAEKVLSSFEKNGIQIDVLHCFGNPETREIELHYKIKNWDKGRNYVVNSKGNFILINGKKYDNNCVFLNGEEQCGHHFTVKVQAKNNMVWRGKYVFKNISDTKSTTIENLHLRFLNNQINGTEEFAEFSNIPITWDAMYIVKEAQKMPERHMDDNNGLIMEIDRAVLHSSKRELVIHYNVKNLGGQRRSFHVNSRSNEMVLGNRIYNLSCAGIKEEVKCDIHWDSKAQISSGAPTNGQYVFKNVTVDQENVIDKLTLRYNESILNTKPYYAIFGQVPLDVEP